MNQNRQLVSESAPWDWSVLLESASDGEARPPGDVESNAGGSASGALRLANESPIGDLGDTEEKAARVDKSTRAALRPLSPRASETDEPSAGEESAAASVSELDGKRENMKQQRPRAEMRRRASFGERALSTL